MNNYTCLFAIRRHAVCLALFGLLSASPPAMAQRRAGSPTIELATVSCPSCSLRFTEPVRIGDRDGPGAFTRWPFNFHRSITIDSRGNVFVGLRDGPSYTPWRFDAKTGRYLGNIGRTGRGPGEFLFPAIIQTMQGDSLFVLDQNQHRYSVLEPRSFKWVRGGPLPGGTYDLLPFNNWKRVVLNSPVHMRDAAGHPLHVFAANGDLITSFGADTAKLDPRDARDQLRVLAASGDTAFWSARSAYRYEFELLSPNGTVLRTFRRTVDWFKPWTLAEAKPFTPTVPPLPYLISMREMPDGRLWVALAVSDPKWARGLTSPKRGEGSEPWYDVDDFALVYDTFIEVIDTRTNRVVASQRFDQFVTSLLPDFRVATVGVDDLQPYLTLHRLSFAGGSR